MTRRRTLFRFMSCVAAAMACVPLGAQRTAADTVAALPLKDRLAFWSPAEQVRGYREIERIFPTHVIRASGRPSPLPKAATELKVDFTFRNRPYTVDDFMTTNRVSGLLIIKDGRILLERYGLGRRPNDRWTSFSIAKSVTSTLMGAAVRDGKVRSLDDKVDSYIPELGAGPYRDVTLRQMMTMSSGVGWDESYDDPQSDFNRHITEAGPALYRFMNGLKRVAAPGTKNHYSTAESSLLGAVVIKATGRSLSDYLSDKIWKPFGMEQDGVWLTSTDGLETGGVCFSAVLRDYGRLGLFMLGNGRAGGAPVLPDGWIETATRQQMQSEYNIGYGYQWWVDSPGVYRGIGIMGQALHIDEKNKLVIVVQSAWSNAGRLDQYELLQEFLKGATLAAKQSAGKK